MKILCKGDIHGDSDWKDIDPRKYDKIVFTGDYVDDWNHTTDEITNNLADIIAFKQANPEKVVLLLGNHDLQYILWNTEWFGRLRCTGFRNEYLFVINSLFERNEQLFVAAYQTGNHLFTHAGLSQAAFELYFATKWDGQGELATFINMLWKKRDGALFHIGELRGGSSLLGSIFWAHSTEVSGDLLKGYHQIVGHTPVNDIEKVEGVEESITFVDTRLGTKRVLELEIP